MQRTLRGRRRRRAPRDRTGCFVCKKNHSKSEMVRVKRPDGEGTVHVCKAQRGDLEIAD
jgi:predicted RNA-binding protein YlxR (DUF448 family)